LPILNNPLTSSSLLTISADSRLDLVVLRGQALLAILVVLPFALWRVWQGQYLMASVGLGAVTLMAVLGLLSFDVARFDRVGRLLLPLVVLGQMVAIGGMIALAGPETKSWLFPVLAVSFLLLRSRDAMRLTLASSAVCAWLVFRSNGNVREAAIFFASCLLLVLATYLFASRLHADNQKFKTRSLQDPLTGVGNRRLLDDTLADRMLRPVTAPCTLIMLDIDHFKAVNDSYGHNVGDACLARIARAIDALKGPGDTLYRFGGEEFVLLTGTDAVQGVALAERVRQHIEQTSIIRETRVTVSAGVAQLAAGQTVREWLNRADTALYQAKASGRNRVVMSKLTHAV
jgi:diguanylate cyclase (GGDEF)-like protein